MRVLVTIYAMFACFIRFLCDFGAFRTYGSQKTSVYSPNQHPFVSFAKRTV